MPLVELRLKSDVSEKAALWIGTTKNRKTGNIPTLFVGRTRKESQKSCTGCPLLKKGNCYSQNGIVAIAHSSMAKAVKRGKDYSLKRALKDRKVTAKAARFGAIGDPASLGIDYVKKAVSYIQKAGLTPIGYTHHWRKKPEFAGVLCGSVESLSEADQAIDQGFQATVVLSHDHKDLVFYTPKGRKGIVCPAISKADKGITCNDCRLCTGKQKIVIGFPDHGPKTPKKKTFKIRVDPRAGSWIDNVDI